MLVDTNVVSGRVPENVEDHARIQAQDRGIHRTGNPDRSRLAMKRLGSRRSGFQQVHRILIAVDKIVGNLGRPFFRFDQPPAKKLRVESGVRGVRRKQELEPSFPVGGCPAPVDLLAHTENV